VPLARPPLLLGIAAAAASIAAITAALYALREIAAPISLGVVYLLAVLLVASYWGAWLGIATAIVSALAFNFFHIPPTGQFTIADGENWVALVIFLVAAVVASALAQAARLRAQEVEQRRREADLAAEMARLLLRGDDLREALHVVAERLSSTLGLPSAAIELGPAEPEGRVAFPLREGARQIATLIVPEGLPEGVLRRLQERVVPQLEALLGAALEREALLADTVETRALRRSDVLKTALLRAVSHDLRTPLTAILTAAEPLGSPTLSDAERAELAAAVGEEARRLARLIDQLLDLSRLEADAASPRPEWCSLDEVLHAAADEVATPAQFTFALAGDLPLVRADAAQLERAFANLLENSARHAGGHPVSVRARGGERRVLVRIVDRGPGIPPAQLDRVFEPFYRSGTDKTGHRGSGLGLAIARGFVEVNHGRVWAESLPGQGTSFVVELPIEPVPEPAAAPPSTSAA
jgi:two-component system sensor histidine kinase KdpD